MQKLLLAGTAGILLVSAFESYGADLPAFKAPPPAPVLTWTGCYIGAAGGGAWGRSRHVHSSGLDITPNFDLSGGILGAEWGCNFQMHRWVWGLESDFSWTNKRGSVNNLAIFDATIVSQTRERWLST